jgi:predicted enzyme related to lactoylglutathione lyase
MADPFDALRAPIVPIAPDAGFARDLRARLVRALGLADAPLERAGDAGAEPAPLGAAVPYLSVADARAAVAWYVAVYGARVVHEPVVMPDDRVGHAEVAIGAGRLYLADAYPEVGLVPPAPGEASVSLTLVVADVDATVAAAVAAGGQLSRPVYEDHGHRGAVVVDPFGHRWQLQTPLDQIATPVEPLHHGDLVYVSLWVPDMAKAAAFFGTVLGWTIDATPRPEDRVVHSTTLTHGVHGGVEEPTLFCCYAVADLSAALDAVREQGGTVGNVEHHAYGTVAECADVQGIPFALMPLTETEGAPRATNGVHHGDLAYVSTQTIDSARYRAFYGAVLGWDFEGGSVEDGWQAQEPAPMVGVQGGFERHDAQPVYRVDDLDAAAETVRLAGGTPGPIEDRPYGRIVRCTDDQGTVFWLNQL